MKKLIFVFHFFLLFGIAFAEATIRLNNTQMIDIKFDEDTPDLWITLKNEEIIDSYKIQAIGPCSNVYSVFVDIVNGKNVLFVDAYLGDPGGLQTVEIRKLYVFEISNTYKIKLLLEKEIVHTRFSVSSNSYTTFQVHFYSYSSITNEITIYDSHAYEIQEIEKIQLRDYVKFE